MAAGASDTRSSLSRARTQAIQGRAASSGGDDLPSLSLLSGSADMRAIDAYVDSLVGGFGPPSSHSDEEREVSDGRPTLYPMARDDD